MPAATSAKRKSPARRARPATSNGGPAKAATSKTRAAKAATSKAASKTATSKAVAPKKAARKVKETPQRAVQRAAKDAAKTATKYAAKKAARKAATTALQLGSRMLQAAADRTGTVIRSAREVGNGPRLPIQVSVDVAVPIGVAWDEWLDSGSLPEGLHQIEEIERDGDDLEGQIAGSRNGEWRAEIVDEREAESFAWRSTEGSDCAGLVTFHQLSERLTRIELALDVVPTNASEAMALKLHMAHRHAEADLRRFKAGVEFINPDVYAG